MSSNDILCIRVVNDYKSEATPNRVITRDNKLWGVMVQNLSTNHVALTTNLTGEMK